MSDKLPPCDHNECPSTHCKHEPTELAKAVEQAVEAIYNEPCFNSSKWQKSTKIREAKIILQPVIDIAAKQLQTVQGENDQLRAALEQCAKTLKEAGATIATAAREQVRYPDHKRIVFNGEDVTFKEMCDLTCEIIKATLALPAVQEATPVLATDPL